MTYIHIEIECTYCGHKKRAWAAYYEAGNEFMIDRKCIACNDKNIKIKKVDEHSGDVFGYRFTEKETPKEGN